MDGELGESVAVLDRFVLSDKPRSAKRYHSTVEFYCPTPFRKIVLSEHLVALTSSLVGPSSPYSVAMHS